MAEIDARATLDVTEIRFANSYLLSGSMANPDISIQTDGVGTNRVICQKSDIDNLIRALQVAKKVW